MTKNNKNLQYALIINLLALMFFIFDRLFKNLAQSGFEAKYFALYYNKGIAFGLDFLDTKILILIIATILLFLFWSLIRIYKAQKLPNKLIYISGLTFVLFGAIANLIDRLLYNQVVDYINLSFWPVFNIADAMIVIGAIVIVLIEFINSSKIKHKNDMKEIT